MTNAARQFRKELLTLPEEDRAWLAQELLASLDGESDLGAEEAWSAEIERRAREVESGAVELLSWEEVSRRIEARLKG